MSEDLPYIQLRGKIIKFEEKGKFRSKRLIAYFQDDTGIIELVWFKGGKWIMNQLPVDIPVVIYGKPQNYKWKWKIRNEEKGWGQFFNNF